MQHQLSGRWSQLSQQNNDNNDNDEGEERKEGSNEPSLSLDSNMNLMDQLILSHPDLKRTWMYIKDSPFNISTFTELEDKYILGITSDLSGRFCIISGCMHEEEELSYIEITK